ncbi:hypothetical protein BH24ACT5_BH24ACT5_14000 [soil metagenome]
MTTASGGWAYESEFLGHYFSEQHLVGDRILLTMSVGSLSDPDDDPVELADLQRALDAQLARLVGATLP